MNQIFRVLAIIILFYVGYKIVKMFQREKSQSVKEYRGDDNPPKGEDLVQDPVCRTYVPKSQAYVKEIDGGRQYFCSKECCEKYLSGEK